MKQDIRNHSPKAQEALRMRVAEADRGGMNQTRTVSLFGVSRQSVNSWMDQSRTDGKRALKAHKRGPKDGIQLQPHQAAQTERMITDRCPDQLKLPLALWTREAVGQLIEVRFGLCLSVWTVGRYLKRRGLTPEKAIAPGL